MLCIFNAFADVQNMYGLSFAIFLPFKNCRLFGGCNKWFHIGKAHATKRPFDPDQEVTALKVFVCAPFAHEVELDSGQHGGSGS